MNRIQQLYHQLHRQYGHPQGQWQLWCKRPKTWQQREEIIIGAILTQRTNWQNVEKAINNLKTAKINSLEKIYSLAKKNKKQLLELLKPSGFFRQKTERLLALIKIIRKKYVTIKKMKQEPLETLRQTLLAIKGIGPETADSILLYGLDKPIFVIDEYTRRLVKKHNLSKKLGYHHLQQLFQKHLKKDYQLYQDFHALIVIHGQSFSLKKK